MDLNRIIQDLKAERQEAWTATSMAKASQRSEIRRECGAGHSRFTFEA